MKQNQRRRQQREIQAMRNVEFCQDWHKQQIKLIGESRVVLWGAV